MDDFRKPYEYVEEKRGFILLFVFMLITIDIIQAPVCIVQAYGHLKQNAVLGTAFMVLSFLYMLFIPYTAVTCYHLKKKLVRVSKVYLVVRAVFLSGCIMTAFLYNMKNLLVEGRDNNNFLELLFLYLILPLVLNLALSVGWYLYFIKSKRCRELVNKQIPGL